jgi:hypothetical protein
MNKYKSDKSKSKFLKKYRGFQSQVKGSEPRKVSSKENWDVYLQYHDGKKSKEHFDLRLWDPKDKVGHSWAMRAFPAFAEKVVTHMARPHSREAFDEKHINKVMKDRTKKIHSGLATVVYSNNANIAFNLKDDELGDRRFALKKVNPITWIFRNDKQNNPDKKLLFEGLKAKGFLND